MIQPELDVAHFIYDTCNEKRNTNEQCVLKITEKLKIKNSKNIENAIIQYRLSGIGLEKLTTDLMYVNSDLHTNCINEVSTMEVFNKIVSCLNVSHAVSIRDTWGHITLPEPKSMAIDQYNAVWVFFDAMVVIVNPLEIWAYTLSPYKSQTEKMVQFRHVNHENYLDIVKKIKGLE